ncbi:MAG: hypothetical protein HYV97_02295 [Bdellovibrio sp.]|nr:hypothetical protein [Bdellovibrio sp.]
MMNGGILRAYLLILMLSACSWDHPTLKREASQRQRPLPISYDSAPSQSTPAPSDKLKDESEQTSRNKKKASNKK